MSNLGAATIRLRSLKAATAERRPSSAEVLTYDAAAKEGGHAVFTKEAKRTHTLYAPQMAPIHFRLIVPVLRRVGYDVKLLEHASREDVEVGLRYVNNDVCYPAIMVVGQLINAFLTGGADPDNSSVAITQTGVLDSLQWRSTARRQHGPGEVEIRVHASGLNFKDLMIALGMVPGADITRLGGECAGVISAVGEGVTHLHVGDPVMAVATGSFATHVIASAAFTIRVPANLSIQQAASTLIRVTPGSTWGMASRSATVATTWAWVATCVITPR